jgi:glutamate synthase (NADPH/NADH) small chain
VIGGGDTGSDCVGTSIRQGAASVTQIEILPKPPTERPASTPWPEWPAILRTSSSQEEGCARDWAVSTREFVGEKRVERLKCRRAEWRNDRGSWSMSETPGSDLEIEADLVLIAMGFVGPEKPIVKDVGCQLDNRGNIATDNEMMTTVEGVFAAGDMRRGQSLVVWVIAEGRRAAAAIGRYLSVEKTVKPAI